MKKRGFGAGWWNGFGGKITPGETIEQAAHREMREEAGVTLGDLIKAGILTFEFQGNPELLEVHIFRASDFTGTPIESEEMKPQWYNMDEIPFDKMWPSDTHWYPLFLANKKFKGKFLLDEKGAVLEKELVEVENL